MRPRPFRAETAGVIAGGDQQAGHGVGSGPIQGEQRGSGLHDERGEQVVDAFDEFNIALCGSGLAAQATYRVNDLTARILFGHRLWVEASRRKERFIGLEPVELRHVADANEVWVNLIIPERALVWRGRSKQSVVLDGGLAPDFDYVKGNRRVGVGCGRSATSFPTGDTGNLRPPPI